MSEETTRYHKAKQQNLLLLMLSKLIQMFTYLFSSRSPLFLIKIVISLNLSFPEKSLFTNVLLNESTKTCLTQINSFSYQWSDFRDLQWDLFPFNKYQSRHTISNYSTITLKLHDIIILLFMVWKILFKTLFLPYLLLLLVTL